MKSSRKQALIEMLRRRDEVERDDAMRALQSAKELLQRRYAMLETALSATEDASRGVRDALVGGATIQTELLRSATLGLTSRRGEIRALREDCAEALRNLDAAQMNAQQVLKRLQKLDEAASLEQERQQSAESIRLLVGLDEMWLQRRYARGIQ